MEIKLDMLTKMSGGPGQVMELFEEFSAKLRAEIDDKLRVLRERV